MLQKQLSVGPALALFPNEVVDRDFHVLEMNFINLVSTLDRDDRLHRHTGRFHVDQKKTYAFLTPCHVTTGAHKAKNPVGEMIECRPGFAAIDDVNIAVPVRAGS